MLEPRRLPSIMLMRGSYAMRKVSRTAGPPELAYYDMRRVLEQYLQHVPPENGRFVQLVSGEERLREALSQRVSAREVLDVMEQRWPYPAQRISVVRQIAEAVGSSELRAAISAAAQMHDLDRSASSAPPEPSSVSVEPSLSTLPPLQRTPSAPLPSCGYQPFASTPGGEDPQQRSRQTAIRVLSKLTRSQWRSLAYDLGITVGTVDDIERAASSSSEASRRVLEQYFDTPRYHKGNMIRTLIAALREQGMNMTADNLTDELRW